MRKKEKGILDLSEIKSQGSKRKDWGNSIGVNIYYTIDDITHEFLLHEYKKDNQSATLIYKDEKYTIKTGDILSRCFGNILGTCVKDFRYSVGDVIKTKRKRCLILNSFRDKKGKKTYTCKCVDCGNVKDVNEDHMQNRGFVCNVCSDKISYPERYVGAFISQLNIKYDYQRKFDWSKNIEHSNKSLETDKIYDFYIPHINTIIEVQGEMHYRDGRWSKAKPIEQVKANDKFKKELALKNNISEYIVLDCEISDSEYIKNSIINSKLNEVFDLSVIDWNKCALDSTTSLMKVCSDLWNNGIRPTQTIADEVGISKPTVITYLKKFAKLGFNDYNPKEEMSKHYDNIEKSRVKKGVAVFKDGVFIDIFNSYIEAEELSKERLGVQLYNSKVGAVARGERKTHKGYHFKYITDLTPEELIKYNVETC